MSPPARLRTVVAICLVALGATMPLYLVVHGAVEVGVLMTFDGLLTGIYMDALMTMGGMASVDPGQRQVDQAGFSFWVSTALIIAPFTTGVLIGVLGIKDIFAIFAIMAGVAALVLVPMRENLALKYVGHRSTEDSENGPGGLAFLFRNKNATFNASLIAALGNKVPYFIVLSFGVLYGKTLGFSARDIFYLIAGTQLGLLPQRYRGRSGQRPRCRQGAAVEGHQGRRVDRSTWDEAHPSPR